jgi:hypothetical protein
VFVVGKFYVPQDRAGLRVERDQMCIARSEEQRVAEHRHSAIVRSATAAEVVRYLLAILPNLPA